MSSMTLSLKGQMAHVSCIALFSPEMATTLHSKTIKNSKKQSFILDILPFSDFFKIFHFGRNGVKFHKSFLLKSHTCTQHIGDLNFQKTIASAPGSICWNDIIKKNRLAELGAVYQMGEFFKIFKAEFSNLCYF